MDLIHRPRRIRQPRRIVSRLSPRRAEPILQIVASNPRLPQPASLIKLMPRRTTDRSIRPRPERPIDELGKQISAVRRAVSQMLRQQLPAVVIGRCDLRIGTLEERNLFGIPIPIAVVPEGLCLKLLLLVEHLSGRLATLGHDRHEKEQANEALSGNSYEPQGAGSGSSETNRGERPAADLRDSALHRSKQSHVVAPNWRHLQRGGSRLRLCPKCFLQCLDD